MSQWLKEHKLVEVFESIPNLKFVTSNDTVQTVCFLLSTNNLYSLPVIDNGVPIGLIDLNDLATLLCRVTGEVTRENGLAKYNKAQEFGTTFLNTKASEVINLSGKNPYTPIPYSASLYEAVEKLVSGTQRLPLVDEDNKIVTIVSPSLVIKYLSHFVTKKEFQPLKRIKVADLAAKFVVSVDTQLPLILSLQQLIESKTASLAITENQHLISTFTLKDLLKAISSRDNFVQLFLPIGDYVTEIRRRTPKAIFPAIHCTVDCTMESLLLRMAATGIHRMFVVLPSAPQATGVVSLRDILAVIIAC